jgi:Predicted membrane protein (DUF2142)
VRQLLRRVEVPAGLDPAPFNCVRSDPRASADCQDHARPTPTPTAALTDVGPYQPVPYVVPGLIARLGDRATGADRLARIGGLAINLALLAIAVALLGETAPLGLALAVTPMVLFLGASVTSSGFEVAAGVAFAAAVIRAAREETGRRERGLLAIAGIALALSRTPGPLWIGLDLVLGAALAGPRTLLRRAGPLSLGAIAIAVIANRLWEARYGPSTTIDLHGGLGESVRQSVRAAPELVGRFGYLEWHLPAWTIAVWGVLTAALIAKALRRRAMVGALVAAAILVPAFWLIALRGTGFALQGRHILPIVVALPLLAGTTARGRVRLTAAGVALVQFAAFAYDARRAATGVDGPPFFLGHAEWTPPGGWAIWLLTAAAGAGLTAYAVTRPVADLGVGGVASELSPVSNREHEVEH